VDVVQKIKDLQEQIPNCESLTVASTDGLILATTLDHKKKGEFLAGVTSFLLNSCSKALRPYHAGECRSLDYRGDRQILLVRLPDVRAFLVCVLPPGAQPVNLDQPTLRSLTSTIPGLLHGSKPPSPRRWFLQRDKACLVPIKHGGVTLGRAVTCDLVLNSPRVESEHARVELVGDTVLVTDLDTEHGSRLNGRKFEGTVELGRGDRLTLPKSRGFTLVATDRGGKRLLLDS
jgi:predicted regulator of Ras-like GTPase activity (Roadblock/LC7/MglB family)